MSPEELAFCVNPWLLSSLLVSEVVVEIDWIEGARPSPSVVEALERTLQKYNSKATLRVILSDEIPSSEWPRHSSEELVARYVDTDPDPRSGTTLVYVLYVPKDQLRSQSKGQTMSWLIEWRGRPALVAGAVVYYDSIRRPWHWWLNDGAELSTLIHEFGHVLGLVENPSHSVAGDPSHCAEARCVMTSHRLRSVVAWLPVVLIGRVPLDLCQDCEADIHMAQAIWASHPFYTELLWSEYFEQLALRIRASVVNEETRTVGERLTRAARTAWPQRSEFLVNLAHFAMQAGHVERAANYLREARGIAGPAQRGTIAGYLCRLGSYTEAADVIGDGVRDVPGWPGKAESDGNTFWALEGSGRLTEALAFLQRSAQGERHEKSVRLLLKMGRIEEASAYVADPRRQIDPMLRARVAHAMGREEEAREYLQGVVSDAQLRIRSHSSDLAASCRLALAFALLDDRDAAHEVQVALSTLEPKLIVRQNERTICQAAVSATLGENDEAFQALLNLPSTYYQHWATDPCLDDTFEPLRRDPRFVERYPRCAGVVPEGAATTTTSHYGPRR